MTRSPRRPDVAWMLRSYWCDVVLGVVSRLRQMPNKERGILLERNTFLQPCAVRGLPCGLTFAVGVKFHETFVLTYLPDSSVLVQNGGWLTQTTAQRINTNLPAWVPKVIWKSNRHQIDRGIWPSEWCEQEGVEWVAHAVSDLFFDHIIAYTPSRKGPCRMCAGKDPVCSRCFGHNEVEYGHLPVHRPFLKDEAVLWVYKMGKRGGTYQGKNGYTMARPVNAFPTGYNGVEVYSYNWLEPTERARHELDEVLKNTHA
jgi:hypothetical protein